MCVKCWFDSQNITMTIYCAIILCLLLFCRLYLHMDFILILCPPDLPRHGCNSNRGRAASGGPTVLANDRNGGRLRLNASRHDDDDDLT